MGDSDRMASGSGRADTGTFVPQPSACEPGSELVHILDRYVADLQEGKTPERARLLSEHPELAAQLEACLAGIDFIHRAAQPVAEAPHQLGDFRIVREVGRGGMGVVYEAEQMSLRRRVALKVLRYGGPADSEALQRFQREAETVGALHHSNIVPIHAFGCEQGIHYYAMQFIEGSSLAAVLEERRSGPSGDAPSGDAKEIARWGVQAAEALAYAHQRGIVHRDIKPSNLLLDKEGTIWLSDFGLARRMDEVALTVTGALLGTPRYMSPEQAAALKQPVDHRSDIYSLGATLYELATGQPVFDAATPHGVVHQILNSEPLPPRSLNRDVPRDLETIILKCIAKDPVRRYPSARELAEDLRLFTLDRAIKAHRPNLAVRTARWLKKQRKSAAIAAGGAAAAVLLVIGFLYWRDWRHRSQLGHLTLTSDGAPMVAEILDDKDELVVPQFTAPTQQPVAAPAGRHRLRLSAPGRLSETYDLLVEQGIESRFDIGPSDRHLWAPVGVSVGCEVIELDGRADVLLVDKQGMRRVDGRTGKDHWQRSLAKQDQPKVANDKRYDWSKIAGSGWSGASCLGLPHGLQPWLARPAALRAQPGDGKTDDRALVWASKLPGGLYQFPPWLLPVSIRDGSVPWWFQTENKFKEIRGGEGQPDSVVSLTGRMTAAPLLEDADGDGVADVIAVFGSSRNRQPPPWIEAYSGKTGQSLWRYNLAPAQEVRDTDDDAPIYQMKYAVKVIGAGKERRLLATIDRRIVELDLQTGKEAAPVRDIGFIPRTTPVLADLIGDGRTGLLLLAGRRPKDLTMVAMSSGGQELWRHVVGAMGNTSYSPMPELEWPVVGDLDGDGKLEVLAPYNNHYNNGWVGVEMLDAATGQSRWRTKVHRAHTGSGEYHGLAHFLIAPDLNKDGCRDIVTAALLLGTTFGDPDQNRKWLLVAAVSGADGAVLWHKTQPLGTDPRLGPLRLGPIGPDGLPRLIVPIVRWDVDWSAPHPRELTETVYGVSMSHKLEIKPQALIFDLATGGLAHLWQGIFEANATDFDGDGFPDLHGLRLDPSGKGELHVLRGDSLDVVRRLGHWLPEVSLPDSKVNQTHHVAPHLPHGDLDGDGVGDVVVFRPSSLGHQKEMKPPLQAYSGKDGRRLWQADSALGTKHPHQLATQCSFLQFRDLDGDGRPEVICVYLLGREQSDRQTGWLAVLAGRGGSVLWKQQLGGMLERSDDGRSPRRPLGNTLQQPILTDVNGDGVLDIVVTIESNRQTELCACDGRNGRILWRVPVSGEEVVREGSGKTLVVASRGPAGDAPPNFAGYYHKISVLDMSDGRETWSWQGPAGDYSQGGHVVTASLSKDGSRSICQLLRLSERAHKPHLAVFSPQGKLVQKLDLGGGSAENMGLWRHDLTGDGNDEVLVVHDGKLHVFSAGPDGQLAAKPLWQWRLPHSRADVLDILPANAQRPALVAVRSENSVHGLDGPTGKPLWRCDGSARPQRVIVETDGQLRVLFHDSRPESTIERRVIAILSEKP